MLAEVPDVTVVGEAGNGTEAVAASAQLGPDVVLLDIRMPGMDGIEAARHLNALDDPPAVVFVTAHDEHALEAFEAQALGYLLKPVRKEKLVRAVQRASRVAGTQLLRVAEQSQLGRRRQHVCARLAEQLRLIRVEEIYYFSADQKYVTVRHRGGSDLIDESLRALAGEFAPDGCYCLSAGSEGWTLSPRPWCLPNSGRIAGGHPSFCCGDEGKCRDPQRQQLAPPLRRWHHRC